MRVPGFDQVHSVLVVLILVYMDSTSPHQPDAERSFHGSSWARCFGTLARQDAPESLQSPLLQGYDGTRFWKARSTSWFRTRTALGSQDVTLGYEAATESRSGGYPRFSLDIECF